MHRRRALLDRLRVLYPLPPKVEPHWEEFRAWFPGWIAQQQGAAVGSYLVGKAIEFKASPDGASLFGTWVKKQLALMPKSKAVTL